MMGIRSTLLASAALTACIAGSANAQTANSGGQQIEEVVVTAQHRNESVQTVAIAVTALTGNNLTEEGIHTARDLQSQVPGLEISPQVFGNLQVFLRGIGSSNNTSGGDPAIPFYIDGAYVSRTTATAGLLYDIDRIEVVKGPQGTLYGRNATGGSINVITKQPGSSFAAGLGADVGNFGSVVTNGYLNLPLTETLAVRASFQTANHNPYVTVIPNSAGLVGNNRQDQADQSGRINLLYKPIKRLSVTLSGDYSHMGGAGAGEQRYPYLTGNPYVMIGTQHASQNNNFANGRAEVNYDLDFATLTYIGAYRTSFINHQYEYPITNYAGHYIEKDQTQTQELRLGGKDGPVTWVLGYYYFAENDATQLIAQLSPVLISSGSPAPVAANSNAVFGQATYALTSRLRLTAGLRYTDDNKNKIGYTTYGVNPVTKVTTATVNVAASGSWTDTNYKAGVEYDLAKHSLAYANVGTGYKAGGFYGGGVTNTYDPEHLTAYEIGVKNEFFDRRMILNAAAYYYDYSNLQVSGLAIINGSQQSVTRNAATATLKGFEVATAYISQNWGRVSGSATYTDAHYGTFILPLGDALTNFGLPTGTTKPADFSGETMPLAPTWSANIGYEYGFALWKGRMTAGIREHYETGKYYDFHDYASTYQKAYTKTDMTLSYQPNSSRWTIEAYVRNLENSAILASAVEPASGSPAVTQVTFAPPRLYGVRVSAEF